MNLLSWLSTLILIQHLTLTNELLGSLLPSLVPPGLAPPGLLPPGPDPSGQAPPKKAKKSNFGACRMKVRSGIKHVLMDPHYRNKKNVYAKMTVCAQKKAGLQRKLPDAKLILRCCRLAYKKRRRSGRKTYCKRKTMRFIYCMLKYQVQMMKTQYLFVDTDSPSYTDPNKPLPSFVPRLHHNVILAYTIARQPYRPSPY
ncbi:hypothetical protein RF11_08809 [Thelohanellus kitauei]|uniref:Uncharacterized protein n=1 Tax=Thelohanellus kitauei TaxID=669202 RepID=A0A0C2IF85_THEKT|nr:hypothetical protein RF11_08809 [Thelohanellus kitauei]